jgi:cobalamin biosynthesis protein CbiG
MAGDETMLAAGIGCRRGTPAEDIETAIQAAREVFACAEAIAVIATETTKGDEPGLKEAARRLGLPIKPFSPAELQSVAAYVISVSPVALASKGTSSVAEAAALLAAGANARLLGPRVANATTTCAFAVGDGPVQAAGGTP